MLSRQLDEFEKIFLASVSYPCDLAQYEGFLDECALTLAYNILCARHPVLCGTITKDGDDDLVCVQSYGDSRIKIVDGDEEVLVDELRALLNIRDIAAQLLVVRGDEHGFVGLCAHHALFDYGSFGAIFDQLWQLYANVLERQPIRPASNPRLPRSPVSLLKERWYAGLESSESTAPRIQRNKIKGRFTEQLLTLNEDETARVSKAARENAASLHGLVCGALLVALRAEARSVSGEVSMACHSAVNLRTRVSPAVADTEATQFDGIQRSDVKVASDSDFVKIGKAVKDRLDADIAMRKVVPIHEQANFKVDTPLEKRLSQLAVSNCGALPLLAQPRGLVIKSRVLRTFTGAEASTICPAYCVNSYNGKLQIMSGYPSNHFTGEEVERINERVVSQLCSL